MARISFNKIITRSIVVDFGLPQFLCDGSRLYEGAGE